MRHKLLAAPFKVSFWAYHLTSAVGGNIAAAVGFRGWWVGFLGPKGSQVVEEMLTRNSRFISFWRYSELPWKRNFFLFKMNFKSQWISMNVLPKKCPERSLPKILPTLVPTFWNANGPQLLEAQDTPCPPPASPANLSGDHGIGSCLRYQPCGHHSTRCRDSWAPCGKPTFRWFCLHWCRHATPLRHAFSTFYLLVRLSIGSRRQCLSLEWRYVAIYVGLLTASIMDHWKRTAKTTSLELSKLFLCLLFW